MRPLLLALVLFVSAPAQGVELSVDVGWAAPVLKRNALGLALFPVASTDQSPEDIRLLFPSTLEGGEPVEWGVRSREGLRIDFEFPVTWSDLWLLVGSPEILTPPSLADLLEGGDPVTVSSIVYREDDGGFADLGDRTNFGLGGLALEGSPAQDSPGWEASIVVEFYCAYALADGTPTGELTSEDVGLPTAFDVFGLDFVPVSNDDASWGGTKARFVD